MSDEITLAINIFLDNLIANGNIVEVKPISRKDVADVVRAILVVLERKEQS